MRSSIAAGALVGLLAFTGSAYAGASLQDVNGPISVNRGTGFELVAGPSSLKPGDRVMADRGGAATIAYSDGCTVVVKPGRVVSVTETPPCLKTTAELQQGGENALFDDEGAILPALGGLFIVGGIVAIGVLSESP